MHTDQPLVSIIIPTYNRAHFIGETLDSVSRQTYLNWECIVVDDGSTDKTVELLQAYCRKDTRFKYHLRPFNRAKGANACRNYGFEISNGMYVNWFDDDDVMLPDFIEKKVSALEANPQLDAIISKRIFYDENLEIIIGKEIKTLLTDNVLEDFISLKIKWYTSDSMWRNKFLEGKTLFNEQLKAGQDRDFHIRMLLAAPKLEVLDAYLTKYRKHPDNITAKIDHPVKGVELRISHIQSVSKLIAEIQNHGKLSEELKIIYFKSFIKYLPFLYKNANGKRLLIKLLRKLSFPHKSILLGWLRFFVANLSLKLTGKGQRFLK